METRKLGDLIPYDKNPRANEKAVEHVLESLKKHGQVAPIIISEKGHPFEEEVICCGHTRAKALKKFGADEASVLVHRFKDEAEFVDLNLRDNKTGEFAEWDEALLGELAGEFEIDLGEMGFDIPEEEDFSDKNEEIDLDEMDDTCELKIKMDAEIYDKVKEALKAIDDDELKALLKVLNVEA